MRRYCRPFALTRHGKKRTEQMRKDINLCYHNLSDTCKTRMVIFVVVALVACSERFSENEIITYDIKSQEDFSRVDSLLEVSIDFPGHLRIQKTSLRDLNGLRDITIIKGNLTIRSCDSLVSFEGLQSLTNVEGNLTIIENSSLISFEGLQSLTNVEGNLMIIRNSSLISFEGLQSLTNVEGSLSIVNNHSVIDIDGLRALTSIGEDIR